MRKITFWLLPAFALALSGWAQQPTAVQQPAPQKFIPVSSGVAQKYRIGGDMPIYPAIAKAAQVQGTVVLAATISEDGKVEDLHVISGPPMLRAAAVDAVRTWTYKPFVLNGAPVGMKTTVNVIFTLGLPAPSEAPPTGPAGQNPQVIHTVVVNAAAPPSDSSPPPANPITAEQVHEMLQLSGADKLRKQMLDTMMPMIRQTMPPYMPPDVLDDFESSFLSADFEAALLRTYQAHLSADDGAQIIAFYKTPAGQHLLLAMPQIFRDSEAAGAQLARQVMMEVIQRHQTAIDAAKLKYESQHPWSAPKN